MNCVRLNTFRKTCRCLPKFMNHQNVSVAGCFTRHVGYCWSQRRYNIGNICNWQQYKLLTLYQHLAMEPGPTRYYSESVLSLVEYDGVVGDTLEDLADYFDSLADNGLLPEDYDCTLADGVMTVHLAEHGTYVINKQTPNRQIWLSSPTSGPKRYDFVHNTWVYSHEPDQCMHQLLSQEISVIAHTDIDFTHLAHGKTKI